jgi:hypothetical protein
MRRYTTEDFILKAKFIFGELYNYDDVNYINSKLKVRIKCEKHGYFDQIPNVHLSGSGCKKCAITNNKFYKNGTGGVMSKRDTQSFINESKEVHNDKYTYEKTVYINAHTKVYLTCKIHGVFMQNPQNHIKKGSGCKKCHNEKLSEDRRYKNFTKIEADLNITILNKTDYINSRTKMNCICLEHNVNFIQAAKHLVSGLKGCGKCRNISKSEKIITEYFTENSIEFESQKKFYGCRHINMLPFDFYIPHLNLCIEYDGEHHFKPIAFYGGNVFFELVKLRDNIKNKYCSENNISLIRISYKDNIIDILNLLIK